MQPKAANEEFGMRNEELKKFSFGSHEHYKFNYEIERRFASANPVQFLTPNS